MLTQTLSYLHNRYFGKGDIKLVMTLLVRNEEDIIADNIHFHASVGVDAFVVLDNASDDNTADIVRSLQDQYDITMMYEPAKTYRQRQWVTRLAHFAKKKLGADWVMSNDADEFWVPKSGNLKSGLDRKGSVVRCPRYNMMMTREMVGADQPYYTSTLHVRNPIQWDYEDTDFQQTMATYLRAVPENVAVNLHGFIRMLSGNHSAWHIARGFKRTWSDNITVYHYPIRDYEGFEKRIIDRREIIRSPEATRVLSKRYQIWSDLYDQNRLREVYDRFLLTGGDIETFIKTGILVEDTAGRDAIKKVLAGR
jgi:glycosyltransferase involved in cell wall biosynthesis